MRARWYDPETGQFLSVDPLAAVTGTSYNYSGDAPTNQIDPTGLIFGIPGTPSFSQIGMGISNFAAGALNGLTGGLSTKLAGDVFGFSASCANFGAAGAIGGVFGFTGALLDGEGEAELAAEEGSATARLVIGRTSDLEAPGALEPGERTLLDQLPNLGSPKANWYQNSSALRGALRDGVTEIRDASPGNTAGQFLNAERNVLTNRGWTFDPSTSLWSAP